MKTCKNCKDEKPDSDFDVRYINRRNEPVYNTVCTECRRDINRYYKSLEFKPVKK